MQVLEHFEKTLHLTLCYALQIPFRHRVQRNQIHMALHAAKTGSQFPGAVFVRIEPVHQCIFKHKTKGCYKGKDGTPGELCGVFSGGVIGDLYVNSSTGIYGKLRNYDKNADVIPVALPQEIETGKAQILATVEAGEPKYYDVEITKVYRNSVGVRNMVIKITDEKLLSLTGGIVQGMSGTPIIQNGMLAGAVTHVFINEPTEGYAIFAENMLVTAQDVEKMTKKAS